MSDSGFGVADEDDEGVLGGIRLSVDSLRPVSHAPIRKDGTIRAARERLLDCVVVGAGISGLYAARLMDEEGLDVIVLEANDRVGGRTFTLRSMAYEYADLGAGYLSREHTQLIKLAQQLDIELYTLPISDHNAFFYRGQTYKYKVGASPTSNPLATMDLTSLIRTLDKFSKQVPLAAPWEARRADEWDAMTLTDFLVRNCWTDVSGAYLGACLSAALGATPDKLSLLHCLHVVRACGGVRALLGAQRGRQEMKMKGGAASLCDRMAKDLGKRVAVNSPVVEIQQGTMGISVRTANDDEYKAKRVIIATSPAVLGSIRFEPPLPGEHQVFIDLKPANHWIKTVTFYDKAFWKLEGFRGDIVSEDGFVLRAIEDTKYNGDDPAIMGLVEGSRCPGLTREDRKIQVTKHYATVFGQDEMRACRSYIERDWTEVNEAQFTGPAVYCLPTGVLTKHKRLWGESFQKVHFAGTECALAYRGTMDGAVRAGEKAAKQVMDDLRVTPHREYDMGEEVTYPSYPLTERLTPSVVQFLIIVGIVVLVIVIVLVVSIVTRRKQPSQDM